VVLRSSPDFPRTPHSCFFFTLDPLAADFERLFEGCSEALSRDGALRQLVLLSKSDPSAVWLLTLRRPVVGLFAFMVSLVRFLVPVLICIIPVWNFFLSPDGGSWRNGVFQGGIPMSSNPRRFVLRFILPLGVC